MEQSELKEKHVFARLVIFPSLFEQLGAILQESIAGPHQLNSCENSTCSIK